MFFTNLKQDLVISLNKYVQDHEIINVELFVNNFVKEIRNGHDSSQLIMFKQEIYNLTIQLFTILQNQQALTSYDPYNNKKRQFRINNNTIVKISLLVGEEPPVNFASKLYLSYLYYKKGLTIGQIANLCNKSQQAIFKRFKHLNISFRSRSEAHSGKRNPMYGQSGALSPRYGVIVSKETREKLNTALKGRKFSLKHRQHLSESKKLYWEKIKLNS